MSGNVPLHYFAYGSNMSLAQMRARCPDSRAVGIGQMPDYALVFPRYSTRRNSGAAGIVPHQGGDVWGVIYAMTEAGLIHLDGFEGYTPGRAPEENNYNRATVTILREDHSTVSCITYLATPQANHFAPSAAYLGTILQGARENGLPQTYMERLARIEPSNPSNIV